MFLKPGDLLVLNDTRVLAARRFSDDGGVEFLFLERIGPRRWRCMVAPGRKMRIGATTTLNNACFRVDEITAAGERIVTFDRDIDVYAGGSMPLPPYLNRPSDESDFARYQTVFARKPGAVAAPTAGLHFTSEILSQISHTFVTLHVGQGTFLPVRTDNVAEHRQRGRTSRNLRPTPVRVPPFMEEVIAEITHLARRHPQVNQSSGVSVRAFWKPLRVKLDCVGKL